MQRTHPATSCKKSFSYKKAIENIMTAIEQGIILQTTKKRFEELEKYQENIGYEIEKCKITQPTLNEKQVVFMLKQFQIHTNERTEEYNSRIMECFISSVHLHDNKLIVTYNLTDEKSELLHSDLENLFDKELSCSDLDGFGGGEGIRTPVRR